MARRGKASGRTADAGARGVVELPKGARPDGPVEGRMALNYPGSRPPGALVRPGVVKGEVDPDGPVKGQMALNYPAGRPPAVGERKIDALRR